MVVSLVTGFFSCAKLDFSSLSTEVSVPWEDMCEYRLCDFPDYHKALHLLKSFSHLLDMPVATSLHVALSISDISDLETYVRGLVEAQSLSLWFIATMFEFLKDSDCVPEDCFQAADLYDQGRNCSG